MGETVEIYERTHQIKAYHSAAVGRLLAALPATNSGEHFAELAAEAYRIALLRDLPTSL